MFPGEEGFSWGLSVFCTEEVSDAKWFEKEDIISRIKNDYEGITQKGGCWDYLIKYYEWKDSKNK